MRTTPAHCENAHRKDFVCISSGDRLQDKLDTGAGDLQRSLAISGIIQKKHSALKDCSQVCLKQEAQDCQMRQKHYQNGHAAQLHWQTARKLIVPQVELQSPRCMHQTLVSLTTVMS